MPSGGPCAQRAGDLAWNAPSTVEPAEHYSAIVIRNRTPLTTDGLSPRNVHRHARSLLQNRMNNARCRSHDPSALFAHDREICRMCRDWRSLARSSTRHGLGVSIRSRQSAVRRRLGWMSNWPGRFVTFWQGRATSGGAGEETLPSVADRVTPAEHARAPADPQLIAG